MVLKSRSAARDRYSLAESNWQLADGKSIFTAKDAKYAERVWASQFLCDLCVRGGLSFG
jgi:hypothetical protein